MLAVFKCILNAIEHSIRMIETAVLKTQHELGVFAHQIEEYQSGSRIVRTVQEPAIVWLLRVFSPVYILAFSLWISHFFASFLQSSQSLCVQRTNRLGQIAIHLGIEQIQIARFIVAENPRENRILR